MRKGTLAQMAGNRKGGKRGSKGRSKASKLVSGKLETLAARRAKEHQRRRNAILEQWRKRRDALQASPRIAEPDVNKGRAKNRPPSIKPVQAATSKRVLKNETQPARSLSLQRAVSKGPTCKPRPTATASKGGSRPFVNWCENSSKRRKGKN